MVKNVGTKKVTENILLVPTVLDGDSLDDMGMVATAQSYDSVPDTTMFVELPTAPLRQVFALADCQKRHVIR